MEEENRQLKHALAESMLNVRALKAVDREGWQVNGKRVYRIYVEQQLIVRRRLKRRRAGAQARVPVAVPTHADQVWTKGLSP